ncbi:IclR family transcriptional regulator [Rhizobium lusitanum]|uniref:IclR family transcriptional regulator n=1 Tax=Rhizobium lusitanum TaxID=293958 RepID=UPI00157405AC|nr:IclR family transcriptional regulator [Rhizobium lusitanum]NTJ11808.1 IclR family transcriptional regulator [Rhizobium lusitanum]
MSHLIELEEDDERSSLDRRQRVQSVEVGMHLLTKLSRMGATVSLSKIAQETGMPASKAHRYIRALIETGLVSQDVDTGLYRLGPEALAIGFAAMSHMDIVSLAGRTLTSLRDTIDETCILCVWSNRGPAVVRIEPASRSIAINVRIGSVLPVLLSAAGLVYAAFSEERHVICLMEEERAELLRANKSNILQQAEQSILRARECGIAIVLGTLTPGVSALGAPVFDHQGHLAGTIVALGPETVLETSPNGAVAREITMAAREVSRGLGHTGDVFAPA